MPSNMPLDQKVTLLALAVLWLPGLAARAAVPASARELGGIRLGMTMDEVKAAAAAHQPPLTLKKPETAPIPGQPGKTFPVSVQGRSSAGPQASEFEDFDITFSPPPVTPRVVRITQLTARSESKAPSKDALQKTLREKFGGPPAAGYPGWVWKASGTPARGKEAEDCLIDHAQWLWGYELRPEGAYGKIKDTSKTCGLIAVASPRDPRVVSISITDYATLAEALAKTGVAKESPPAGARDPGTPR
jgi:hypothetical protein